MHILRLLRTLIALNIQQELAYRADAIVNMLLSLMWLGWDLLGLGIIFSNTDALAGWSPGQLIALLGVFRLVNTLMGALIWPNTERFNAAMRDGTLDYTLLQPAPSLFLVTFTRIIVWRIWDTALGAALIVIGIGMSGDSARTGDILAFLLLFASGTAIIYSLWVVMLAITFLFVKLDNNVTVLQALLDTGRYPSAVYPVWLRVIVTFVIPVALATSVPVRALRGELAWPQILAFLAVGAGAVLVAIRAWKAGVRRYAGASS